MNKQRLVIQTDVGTLLQMYEILETFPKEMDTEDTRIKILVALGRTGKKVSISSTSRSKEEVIEGLRKHYKNIKVVRGQDE